MKNYSCLVLLTAFALFFGCNSTETLKEREKAAINSFINLVKTGTEKFSATLDTRVYRLSPLMFSSIYQSDNSLIKSLDFTVDPVMFTNIQNEKGLVATWIVGILDGGKLVTLKSENNSYSWKASLDMCEWWFCYTPGSGSEHPCCVMSKGPKAGFPEGCPQSSCDTRESCCSIDSKCCESSGGGGMSDYLERLFML